MKKILLVLPLFLLLSRIACTQTKPASVLAQPYAGARDTSKLFWRIAENGGTTWDLTSEQRLPHHDNIEMSGARVSAIIYYEINKKKQLEIKRDIIFPQLRTFDKTNGVSWQKFRAYRRLTYSSEVEPGITLDTTTLVFDKVDSVNIHGKLSFYHTPVKGLALIRSLFPSMSDRLFVEKWTLTNVDTSEKNIRIGNSNIYAQVSGYKGIYHNNAYTNAKDSVKLKPGDSYSFGICFTAAINNEPFTGFDVDAAEKQRDQFLQTIRENMILKTGDQVLDRLFYFSKIRAAESIFESKMGLVHSPGGGNYYVGVWANDQAEYSGPFFPLLGYDRGTIAAANAYRTFLKHIPAGEKPIPYSFEIEGDIFASNKDRGDAAMIAYGASLFLLRTADKKLSEELWPLVEWCLEYCNRKLNSNGVVLSQTDEMEGRIATGDANLATSALYYGGLKYAAPLARELGYARLEKLYKRRLTQLEQNIETHFGSNIDGLATYRYFEGNKHLRHWISLPLVMGINTRAEATTTALLDKLWTDNGVLVELKPSSNNKTFWDRGTLYVLRGTFRAGYFDKSLEKLRTFSAHRLLGDHTPYVVEAYPENNMSHLSAESALYCRIFIEGILGFEQTGFNKCSITPTLSQALPTLTLDNIHIGKHKVSVHLKLINDRVHTLISSNGKTIVNTISGKGQTVSFRLPG